MKNILIINGHQKYSSAEGNLNQTLMNKMVSFLSEKNNVKTTIIQKGYKIEEEQQKFIWADIVIYQTPIYWFSVPGLLKSYMDEVYAYGLFFRGADQYGKGGLLTEKKYMFSTTWNAPEKAFNDPSQFFEGSSLEDALSHLHRIQKFLGMKPLKSFSCYDVVKNPKVEKFVSELDLHLQEVLNF
ncbi:MULTISPECIES: NAD(P)H-dependent oxidoreductase [Lysinibacillus]|uniref:NAD(P)H-dependent oxidoreductase n=1 Tax=Lysinibacillus TaxID=400634 RepID=UPI0010519E4B|nr:MULTISPECIES: NAD(P)H-dependent oxidoreductase [Lysinibacillus]MCK1988209.1 NAD(P)H-dependent oxidoreductase [Lysinibacillus fusiformis]MCR8854138.1 NAD(P)H-dependent oxidoreductase [Lysinibacillus fusiformis]MDD1501726.1 NAD(P)H-dependent oxidoreductase [Lysinibacillus sp. CNPSo 3705]WKT79304.1 NAD(P)H-dependent oxidoreductase [Lysinibacillus fusiformis]